MSQEGAGGRDRPRSAAPPPCVAPALHAQPAPVSTLPPPPPVSPPSHGAFVYLQDLLILFTIVSCASGIPGPRPEPARAVSAGARPRRHPAPRLPRRPSGVLTAARAAPQRCPARAYTAPHRRALRRRPWCPAPLGRRHPRRARSRLPRAWRCAWPRTATPRLPHSRPPAAAPPVGGARGRGGWW